MKSAELENYIRKRLGYQIHRFDLYRDMTQLMLRYRWIGDKLFDMDPENPIAPCFLSNDSFLLFALDPSVERLRFFKKIPLLHAPISLSNLSNQTTTYHGMTPMIMLMIWGYGILNGSIGFWINIAMSY